ncbi:MAG: tetratricopeptide repeat protein [Methanothrix sp.]|nr:tetratricopeptide repeat protein [Methanothrix sp.]
MNLKNYILKSNYTGVVDADRYIYIYIYIYIIIILILCCNASSQSYKSQILFNSHVEGIFHRADLGELYPWEKYEISITCPSLIWPWGYKIYKLNPSAPSGLDLVNEQWLPIHLGRPVQINSIAADSTGPGHYYLLLASCTDIGLSVTNGFITVDDEVCVGPSTTWDLAIKKFTDLRAEQYQIERGNELAEQNQQREAIECYDYALWINPGSAQALTNKGIALFQLGEFEEAIDCFNAALELNPQSSEAWIYKGHALAKLKRYPEAIVAFQNVPNKQDIPDVWIDLGIAFFNINDFKNSTNAFSKATELNREYKETYKREISRAWNEWGKVLARQDNPCEAADAFAKALSVDSRYLDAIRNRAIAESRCHILQPVANASRNLTN